MIKIMAAAICAIVAAFGLTLPSGNAAAQNFATTAANDDDFAAQASALAAKSGDDRLSALAAQMMSDQQRNKSQLRTLTGDNDDPASNAHKLDDAHQRMLDQLKTKSGDDFKATYLHDLIDEEQKQIATYQNQMQRGADPKLKGWAAQNVPRLRSRLKQLEEIARED